MSKLRVEHKRKKFTIYLDDDFVTSLDRMNDVYAYFKSEYRDLNYDLEYKGNRFELRKLRRILGDVRK